MYRDLIALLIFDLLRLDLVFSSSTRNTRRMHNERWGFQLWTVHWNWCRDWTINFDVCPLIVAPHNESETAWPTRYKNLQQHQLGSQGWRAPGALDGNWVNKSLRASFDFLSFFLFASCSVCSRINDVMLASDLWTRSQANRIKSQHKRNKLSSSCKPGKEGVALFKRASVARLITDT